MDLLRRNILSLARHRQAIRDGEDFDSCDEIADLLQEIHDADHGFDFGKEKGRDEFFYKAAEHIIDSEKASIGYLQRIFRIGFNRASTLLDELADAGIVGPDEGTITRRVLFTKEDYEDWKSRGEPKDFFPLHANSKKFAQITDVNKADEANVRSTPPPKKTFFQRLFNR